MYSVQSTAYSVYSTEYSIECTGCVCTLVKLILAHPEFSGLCNWRAGKEAGPVLTASILGTECTPVQCTVQCTVQVYSALYRCTVHCIGVQCTVQVYSALYRSTVHCIGALYSCTVHVHCKVYSALYGEEGTFKVCSAL